MDLGVLVADNLKPGSHISEITKRANQRIGMIKRTFSNFNFKTIDYLFNGIIRPTLEYGAPTWSPWIGKDISKLEKVQERCYKLVRDQEVHPEPQPLIERRVYLDLCEVYKIIHGKSKCKISDFFQMAQSSTRGHSLKIQRQFCRTDKFKFFFSNRVISTWNELPEHIVTASDIDIFKNLLRSLPQGQKR